MNEDLFRREFRTIQGSHSKDNLFVWTVGVVILIGIAMACWLGAYYLFGHPEKPDSYHILRNVLHKLDPPKRFELTAAPAGTFLSPQKAFETYGHLSDFGLQRKNEELLRDYIRNYQSTKNLVSYITGRYSIISSYELKRSDFIGVGMVTLAQAADSPQVLIEHLYPSTPRSLPMLEQMLRMGLDIKLERSQDLSAVIHVTRTPDGRLLLTAVPLLYGAYTIKQGEGSFSLEPPPYLNPAAGLPVIRGPLYTDALKTFAAYTQKYNTTPEPGALPGNQPTPQVSTIVHIATPTPVPTPTSVATAPLHVPGTAQGVKPRSVPSVQPSPLASTSPAVPSIAPTASTATTAPALPTPPETGPTVPPPVPPPVPLPTSTPIARAASPTATPKMTSPKAQPTVVAAIPISTPTPTPALLATAVASSKVPLQPFLVSAATPTPGLANTATSWRTYSAGKLPPGRQVTLFDANNLADQGIGGERLYLRGNFVVSVSNENRAVLRPSNTLTNAFNTWTNNRPPRVVVEYPAGKIPPGPNATLSRDEQRPFEITGVKRDANGQVTIYTREITHDGGGD